MPHALSIARHWLAGTRTTPVPDADLLSRFVAGRDEAAFAALVDRHGPMVLGVARRVVRDHHAAEDVFQATFLALARDAGRLRHPDALPAWLHHTAYHLGLKAVRSRDRRRRAESACPGPRPWITVDALSAGELLVVLDEELARLPDRFRLPLLLCCLEGLSHEEASGRLGWTPASVKGRLERGRQRLRDRFARRGLPFPAAAGVPLLLLAREAVAGELREAALQAATGTPPPTVAALAARVARPGMRVGWAAVLSAGVVVAGLALATGPVGLVPPASENPPPAAPAGDRLPDGAVARVGWSAHRVGNSAFALSADSKEIITVSPEGAVRRFDANTGRLLEHRQLTPREDVQPSGQTSARVSGDGRAAAITERVGRDSRLTVWDVPAGKVLFRRVPEKGTSVGDYALSRDGKRLAVREDVGGKTLLRVYDTATGKRTELGELEYNVYDIQFSADASRIVVREISSRAGPGPREFLTCFDTVGGGRVWKLPHKCVQFAFSPDGRTVVYAGFDQQGYHVIETDPTTGKTTERLQKGRPAHPNVPVLFAPDSRTLLVDHFDALVLWDVVKGEEVGRVAKPRDDGSGYGPMLGAFSADGKTVVTNHGVLRRWDLVAGKPLFDPRADDGLGCPIEHMAFTADGKQVVASGWFPSAGRWDVAGGKRVAFHPGRFGHQFVTTPAGLRSVGCDHYKAAHEVVVYDPVEGAEVRKVAWTAEKEVGVNGMRAYALAADGRTLLVAHGIEPDVRDQQTFVTAHDVTTGRRLARLAVPGNYYFEQSPFSPCGRWVAIAGKVYHAPTGTELFAPAAADGGRLAGGGRWADGPVWFSADGRLLAGRLAGEVTPDGPPADALVVWELASARVIARLTGTATVADVVFAPDGRLVALADGRGVRLYDLLTGRNLATLSTPDIAFELNERGAGAQTVAFAPDGKTLATGHRTGSITLWAVPRAEPTGTSDAWADLGNESPAVARAAVDRAARDPAGAVKLLTEKFAPPKTAADPRIPGLIADLGSDTFATREAASARLRELGAKAESALRQAAAGSDSAEVRQRAGKLLAALPFVAPAKLRLPAAGELLRGLRAVEVLERAGTPEARALLAGWASQEKDLHLASEARTALDRLRLSSRPGR